MVTPTQTWRKADNKNNFSMAKYSKKAEDKIHKVMREKKRGTLRSSSGQKVTSRKQAIAIGISEARRSGAKVPKQKKETA